MLEGKCPKCGFRRIGWAMNDLRHQTCPNCGTPLEITDSSYINPPNKAPLPPNGKKEK